MYSNDENMEYMLDALGEILSYYQCPEECHAYCCKVQPIDLNSRDKKILKPILKKHPVELKTSKKNGRLIHTMDFPCSFLQSDDRCSVYARRPQTCRTYPFYLGYDNQVAIIPCHLGLILCRDIAEYIKDRYDECLSKNEVEMFVDGSFSFYNNVNDPINILGFDDDKIYAYRDHLKNREDG